VRHSRANLINKMKVKKLPLLIFGLMMSIQQYLLSKFPLMCLQMVWLVIGPFNGNANDESGNGFNGTINGAILTSVPFWYFK